MGIWEKLILEGGQNGGDQQVVVVCLFLCPESGHCQLRTSTKMRRHLISIIAHLVTISSWQAFLCKSCPKGCGDLLIGHDIGATCFNGAIRILKLGSRTIPFKKSYQLWTWKWFGISTILFRLNGSWWMWWLRGFSHLCPLFLAATWVGSMPDLPKEQWQQEKLPLQRQHHAAPEQLPAPGRLPLAKSYP